MDWNLADVYEAIARLVPDWPCLVRGQRVVTWQDVDRRAGAVAADLVAAGLSHQSKVAVYLHSCPEFLESYVAIVATGPSPRTALQLGRRTVELTSSASTPVFSSWEVPNGVHSLPRGPVIMLDDVGHMEGMSVAQHLVANGCDVTVVTRFSELASLIQPAWATWSGKEYLAGAGVVLLGRSFVSEVGDGTVTVSSLMQRFLTASISDGYEAGRSL